MLPLATAWLREASDKPRALKVCVVVRICLSIDFRVDVESSTHLHHVFVGGWNHNTPVVYGAN